MSSTKLLCKGIKKESRSLVLSLLVFAAFEYFIKHKVEAYYEINISYYGDGAVFLTLFLLIRKLALYSMIKIYDGIIGVWKVIRLFWFLLKFYLSFWNKYCSYQKIRTTINDSIELKHSTIKVSLISSLIEYQDILQEITLNPKINRLEWTNIYPPEILLKAKDTHRKAYGEKKNCEKKTQICIITDLYRKAWQDLNSDKGKLDEFEKMIKNNGGDLLYAVDRELKDLKNPEVRIGDFAIFNDSLILSFNSLIHDQVTKVKGDQLIGELVIAVGSLDSYPEIFRAGCLHPSLEKAMEKF